MAARQSRPKAGFVYLLSNESMPGIVKIGMTARNPEVRLREINSATGVLPFVLEAVIASKNAKWTEQEVHERLAGHRVRSNREFFKIGIRDAKRTIFAVAREQSQRAYSVRRRGISPVAAAILALAMTPPAAVMHPYLAPLWLALCGSAAVFGRPVIVREFLGMTERPLPALAMSLVAVAGVLLTTGVTAQGSLANAVALLSETQRLLGI